jgi:hypothetical protein
VAGGGAGVTAGLADVSIAYAWGVDSARCAREMANGLA